MLSVLLPMSQLQLNQIDGWRALILHPLTIDIAAFGIAFVIASLVEYWVHRLMHQPYKLGEKHRDHHRRNEGQGVVWEFRDYLLGQCHCHGAAIFLVDRSWFILGRWGCFLRGFLRLRPPVAARKSPQMLLDEDAGALRSP